MTEAFRKRNEDEIRFYMMRPFVFSMHGGNDRKVVEHLGQTLSIGKSRKVEEA